MTFIDLPLLIVATVQKHNLPASPDFNQLTILVNREFNLDATVVEVTEAYYTGNAEQNIVEQEEDFNLR